MDLALGTHQAGFHHLGLVEFDAAAASTLRANCQGPLELDPCLVIEDDARNVDYTPFIDKVDLLTAGPPCQPFSAGGNGLGPDDPRNMFPTLLDVIATIRPRAVLIENVRGLTRNKFADYFMYIRLKLQYPLHHAIEGESWSDHLVRLQKIKDHEFADDEQFAVDFQIVDAANYGIPQRRHRVFIQALRQDLGLQPFSLAATHSMGALFNDQWVTGQYWIRHGLPVAVDLSTDAPERTSFTQQASFSFQSVQAWRTVRDAIGDLPLGAPRGKEPAIPNHVQHPGARTYKGHVGSSFDAPAKALKSGAHGTPGGENTVQLSSTTVRYLTIREAARLQTFPDTWTFTGPWGSCIRQLGNAVPVELAAQYTRAIYDRLSEVMEHLSPSKSQDAFVPQELEPALVSLPAL